VGEPLDVHNLLGQYEVETDRLAEQMRAKANIHAAELTTYAQVWAQAGNSGPTERSALARNASSHLTAELSKIEGEIQATLARLRYLDHALNLSRELIHG